MQKFGKPDDTEERMIQDQIKDTQASSFAYIAIHAPIVALAYKFYSDFDIAKCGKISPEDIQMWINATQMLLLYSFSSLGCLIFICVPLTLYRACMGKSQPLACCDSK